MDNYRPSIRLLLILIVVTLVACSTGSSSPSLESSGQRFGPTDSLVIRVGIVDGPMLPGAQVYLATRNGSELHGTTDSLGVTKIPRERLTTSGAYAVIVCSELFHCGALRYDSPRLLKLTDGFIALAPFRIN